MRIIKVKLGREPQEDIERIKCIREAIGDTLQLRIDANQGWSKSQAQTALTALSRYNIEFCEQPMCRHDDQFLPELKRISPVPIMANESVFDHYDAERIIKSNGCSYVNIKFAKSGGMLEAQKIAGVCGYHNIPCIMGVMLESRIALTAFAHFAATAANVKFYDMDTCLPGHKLDPVTGGVTYNNFHVELPDAVGIGADADEDFLLGSEHIII